MNETPKISWVNKMMGSFYTFCTYRRPTIIAAGCVNDVVSKRNKRED